MCISLSRIQSLNVLQNLQYSPRDYSHNLIREFSRLSCGATNRRKCHLLNVESCRVPSRSYYKHEVEVAKRIKWKRPEKVPCILPQKSGDLSALPDQDFNKPPPLFKESTEYQTSSDLVKRVLSIGFQPSAVRKQAVISSVVEKVKRHKLDTDSVEAKIAKWTAIIRNLQVHCSKYPQDRQAKADLKEIIEFRKKRMKLLRSLDYKRFEWLLEQLDLLYKPAPSSHERVERKKSMRWLTAQYIETIKQKKLEEYKIVLDSKKKEFLQSKFAAMKAIVEEETSFGVEPSFTSQDIKEVEETLRQRILEEEKIASENEDMKEVY